MFIRKDSIWMLSIVVLFTEFGRFLKGHVKPYVPDTVKRFSVLVSMTFRQLLVLSLAFPTHCVRK